MRKYQFNIKRFAKKNYNTKVSIRDLVIELYSHPNLRATAQVVRQHFRSKPCASALIL